MSIQAVLLPLFVQVLLTFALMFGMMYFRMNAFRSGETRLSEIAMREPNWPKRATQFAYAFSNQFELPVLFYVLTLLCDRDPACGHICSSRWPGCSWSFASCRPSFT